MQESKSTKLELGRLEIYLIVALVFIIGMGSGFGLRILTHKTDQNNNATTNQTQDSELGQGETQDASGSFDANGPGQAEELLIDGAFEKCLEQNGLDLSSNTFQFDEKVFDKCEAETKSNNPGARS